MRRPRGDLGSTWCAGALVAALVCVACGDGARPAETALDAPSSGAKDVTSGSPLERYFPLVDGRLYHYRSTNDLGEEGMLVARVFRASASSGELRFPSGGKRFEYREASVMLIGGPAGEVPVLLAPLTAGNSWRGEHGGVTSITSSDAAVVTPAGRFEHCVVTVEERRGDVPARFATTFCPDVGIAVLEVERGGRTERAELKSYGAPLVIGQDGLQRVP